MKETNHHPKVMDIVPMQNQKVKFKSEKIRRFGK